MSDTDKTRPEWVQINDPHNRGWRAESHHHHGKECDIEDYDPQIGWRSSRCHVWPSRKAEHEGIYPRPSRRIAYYSYKHIRRERAHWRGVRDQILSGNIDAADESPLKYGTRHAAIWDAY